MSKNNNYPPWFERFWSKVDKTGDCWVWTAYCIPKGYGQFSLGTRSPKAHRVSWELAHGPIPEGLLVLHKCDNPPCVRPSHLFLGTHLDNNRDCANKGRTAGQKLTHCHKGHKFTSETVRMVRGWRVCRICDMEKQRRYYQRRFKRAV